MRMGDSVRGFVPAARGARLRRLSYAISGLALGVVLLSACGRQGALGAAATPSGRGGISASSAPSSVVASASSATGSGAGSPAAGTPPCYLTAAQASQIVGQQLSFTPIVSGPADGQCFFATADQKWYIEIRPDPSPGLFPTPVCDASAEVGYDVEQLPGGCLVEQIPPYSLGYVVYIYSNGSASLLDLIVTTPSGVSDAPFTSRANTAAAIIEGYMRRGD